VHDASAVCPVATPYLPAPQAVHDTSADPPIAFPYLPAPQAVHDASAVCPVATPYLPAPQAVHHASAVCPAATPYLPRRSPCSHHFSQQVCTSLLRRLHIFLMLCLHCQSSLHYKCILSRLHYQQVNLSSPDTICMWNLLRLRLPQNMCLVHIRRTSQELRSLLL
jgi:hypothetical protein